MFFVIISTLLAAAAAQCQGANRPCSLSSSGTVGGSTTVGVCVVSATSQVGQCSPQCRDASSTGCFLTTSSNALDGVCQTSSMSQTPTCVAKSTTPSCTVDRPCAFGNTVGVCTSTNGTPSCKAQCQASGPNVGVAQVCFLGLTSQARDGRCNANAVCQAPDAATTTTAPQPTMSTCPTGSRCRLSTSSAAGTEVGVCSNNACTKQCQQQGTQPGLSGACYTSFNVDAADGICDAGVCKAKSTMPQGCVNVLDACVNANNVQGKCAKSENGALQCAVLANCNSFTAPSTCTFINSDGVVKAGVCSQNGCTASTPMCQLGAPGAACKVDGVDGKVSSSCTCVKDTTTTPVQQCSANTEGQKCQATSSSGNTMTTFGVCKQGRCDTGSTPTCQLGAPGAQCKVDGVDGKVSSSCTCVKDTTTTPVQQCSANTEGQKCQLPSSAGVNTMATFGVCKQSACVGENTQPQCKPGDVCKASDGSDGKWTDKCECVKRSDPNAQCQKDGDKCTLLTPGSNTMQASGVCKQGQCVGENTQPQCKPGDLCKADDGSEGKWTDKCECVKRSDPNTQCQKDGDKCSLLTPGSNTMQASGVCKQGRCVSGDQPPKPCTNGAFCEPAAGQRGVCRNQVCEVVKCMSDDNCLSSDSTTKRVCLAFQCVPAPTTMTNPCSDNIKCENGGKCVVVAGANAGFSDAQLKQSVDIASTYNGLAGVCVCTTGFKGATCEVQIDDTPTEKPASCLCGNGMVARDGFCVQTAVKTCDCNKNCLCTKESSDQCSQPEKKPNMAPTGYKTLLNVVFNNDANLLQALGTVKSLLEKYESVQVNAEKTDVGLRVTVSVKGDVDPALVDSVKAAAASLRNREDVVDAVVQDVTAMNDPSSIDSASSLMIGASVMLIAAVAMN
jgi:hypothetical protein